MTIEIWKDIPGWEGYKVSNLGRIYSYPKKGSGGHNGKLKSVCIDPGGYPTINFCDKGKRGTYKTHRLVAIEFIPNPENKPCVNHKNGIKTDCRAVNLEWCTYSENARHSIRTLGNRTFFQKNKVGKMGGENHSAKIILQYSLGGEFIKEWGSISDISRALKIPTTNISKVCMGNRKKAGGFIFTYQKQND